MRYILLAILCLANLVHAAEVTFMPEEIATFPQGPQGDQGPRGPSGDIGPPGIPGPAGENATPIQFDAATDACFTFIDGVKFILTCAQEGSPPSYQCSNGVDDDNDGETDYPEDDGCISAQDDDETDPVAPPPPASCGEPYRGIPDPCAHMGYDVFADYPVDEVVSGNQGTIRGTGTAADPYFVDASGLNRSGRITVEGEYVIVVGGYGDYPETDGPALRISGCDYCTVRDMEVFGDDENFNAGHDSASSLGSNNVVVRLKLHGFGDRRVSAPEQDYHGAKIQGENVWILDSDIYDVSGDSIQCGDASRGDCRNVYIGGGWMHDNRENGIDIKDSTGVVVSGVRMSGFAPTSSSPGEALIVHDDAFDAQILDNIISGARLGIVSSGTRGHVIDGNTIEAELVGIQLRNTRDLTVTNNKINAPECVEIQGGTTGTIQTGCD